MLENSNKRRAVTLVEVLISTFVLSMLLTSVFMVFRSGSKSFSSGSWRIQNQKMLQVFMARLKDYLEKANYAHEIGKDGNLGHQVLPICINSKALDQEMKVRGTDTDLMFFAVTESYKEGQPEYGVPTTNGSWLGVALLCRGTKLILKADGDWDRFASDCAPPADIRPANMSRFPARTTMQGKVTLDDVESVFISKPHTETVDKNTGHMKVRITLRKYDGGKPTQSFITEEIGVSLIEKNPEVDSF
jgi:hypothetical protein